MGTNGVTAMKKRLHVSLTEIFERLYPQAISFNFDGLLTASNNFTGKGSAYFFGQGVGKPAIHIIQKQNDNGHSFKNTRDFPEPKFTQEILLAEELTEDLAHEYAAYWRACKSAAVPKGRLIWV